MSDIVRRTRIAGMLQRAADKINGARQEIIEAMDLMSDAEKEELDKRMIENMRLTQQSYVRAAPLALLGTARLIENGSI